MTTEAAQDPQTPQPPVMDVAEVYRTLGRLEAVQSQTREILVRIEQRLDRQEERNDQRFAQQEERNDQRFTQQEERNDQRFGQQEERNDRQFREVNRRIDRLGYTIVGIGAAIIVGYVLQQVFGA